MILRLRDDISRKLHSTLTQSCYAKNIELKGYEKVLNTERGTLTLMKEMQILKLIMFKLFLEHCMKGKKFRLVNLWKTCNIITHFYVIKFI